MVLLAQAAMRWRRIGSVARTAWIVTLAPPGCNAALPGCNAALDLTLHLEPEPLHHVLQPSSRS
jgi:hypothetical protein